MKLTVRLTGSDEVIFIADEEILKQTASIKVSSNLDEECAMNTIVANVLMREAAKAQEGARPVTTVILFCSLGLIASLCALSMGFDVSGGGF
jgi:hypothetical protein